MQIRNVAVIAHVDHGKTTLVDQMLRQAGIFRANEEVAERVMDSNPLERERGITILSKNTAVRWGEVKINIVDTPGHADFGGEVERILRMVEGVLILVDAAEGPMPQTRFVTRKALELGLLPVVVINKVDRPDARPADIHDEVLELFMELNANDAQLDAPFVYASGREGWATTDLAEAKRWRSVSSDPTRNRKPDDVARNLTPLFQTILGHLHPPPGDPEGPFQMLVSTLDFSPYVGRIAIGRIERGRVNVGDRVTLLPLGLPGPVPEDEAEERRVMRLYEFRGLQRLELDEASAGDIVALAGVEGVEIGTTLTDPDHRERMKGIAVEEPTLSVDFSVNDSPMAGRSGKYVTSRQLRERLFRELERNLALRVEETGSHDTFTVSGRGELHLTILMETMRREGYEFQVSRPRVILKEGKGGIRLEPHEEVVIEVPVRPGGCGHGEDGGERRDRGGDASNGSGNHPPEVSHSHPGAIWVSVRIPYRHSRGGDPTPPLSRVWPLGRHHDRQKAGGPGGRSGGGSRGLCPFQPSGACRHVRDPRGPRLRRNDRGGARASRGYGRERLQGKEGDQYQDHRLGREHQAGTGEEAHPGTGHGVHRGRRAHRDHPRLDTAQKANTRPEQAPKGGTKRC